MRLAQAESRVVVTFDLDFSRILAMQRMAEPSVILLRLERFTTEEVNQLLIDLIAAHAHDLAAGAVIVADAYRFRVRRLPIL